MSNDVPQKPAADPLTTLRELSLEQLDVRLSELDGERASLVVLRRSLIARRRAEQKCKRIAPKSRSRGADV